PGGHDQLVLRDIDADDHVCSLALGVARTRSCPHAGSRPTRPWQLYGLCTTSDRDTALADNRCVTPSGLRAGARDQLAPNFARTADTSGLSGHLCSTVPPNAPGPKLEHGRSSAGA